MQVYKEPEQTCGIMRMVNKTTAASHCNNKYLNTLMCHICNFSRRLSWERTNLIVFDVFFHLLISRDKSRLLVSYFSLCFIFQIQLRPMLSHQSMGTNSITGSS
jgi:hypothetical protein